MQAQTPTQPLGLQSWQLELVRTGVSLHYVTSQPQTATKGALLFVHGWPDTFFTWRRQVAFFTAAGWRCIMVDQRGFGESIVQPESARRNPDSYSQQLACKDLELLCRAENVKSVVCIGHDWGGAVAWSFARRYPSLCAAVAVLCTPYRPKKSRFVSPEEMSAIWPAFWYQVYFSRSRSCAVEEFEANPERLLRAMYRSGAKGDSGGMKLMQKGSEGFLAHAPAVIPRSPMVSQEELEIATSLLLYGGFDSGLCWYSSARINWEEEDFYVNHTSFDVRRTEWNKLTPPPAREDITMLARRIEQPALMITAANDPVLAPAMSVGMEQWMPRLSRLHVEQASHWAHQDRPKEVNEGLSRFIEGWQKQAKL